MIVSASCGLEPGRIVEYKPLLDQAIELSEHKPGHCIVIQRPQARATMIDGRDVDWHDAVEKSERRIVFPVAATDPLYILYTSGTTGTAKGCGPGHRGGIVALKWSMKSIYNVEPGECLLDGLGCGLGGRAFLYCLCAVVQWQYDYHLRRQACGNTGCRGFLEGDLRT